MRLIEPDVEYWAQGQDAIEHIARCARICYASEKNDNGVRLVDRLKANKHLSMFRHMTSYYHLGYGAAVSRNVIRYVMDNNYCGYVVDGNKKSKNPKHIYFAINGQFALEHSNMMAVLEPYEISESQFLKLAKKQHSPSVRNAMLMMIRHTVCVTTQISTSRELNRKSPNNIAEQSTRYVNFGKRGKGICICKPALWDSWSWWQRKRMKLAWWVSEKIYLSLVRHGMADKNFNKAKYLAPEHARGVLPLDTATKVVYTYSGKEWRQIFDLRLRGTTGKPHPNAVRTADLIRDEIMSYNSYFEDYGLEL